MPVTVTNGRYFSMSFETFVICMPNLLVYDRKHKGLGEDELKSNKNILQPNREEKNCYVRPCSRFKDVYKCTLTKSNNQTTQSTTCSWS